MQSSLTFHSTTFDVIDRNGQPWLQSRQLAVALGYKDENSVRRIFERNKDEFTACMTATVKMTVGITPVEVRIFSPRGCHLLAMFARTSIAKEFRAWVLDVLEGYDKSTSRALSPQQAALEEHRAEMTKLFNEMDKIALDLLRAGHKIYDRLKQDEWVIKQTYPKKQWQLAASACFLLQDIIVSINDHCGVLHIEATKYADGGYHGGAE